MFTKIKTIDNFAVFNGFDWNSTVRDSKGNNVAEFRALNIIYGRNYSGKTTLSRMFRSIEKGKLHQKYPDAKFEFGHSGTDKICELDVNNCDYNVRVYNKDFISDNLKWLLDEDGTIKPFAILGKSNVAIEREISEKEILLGNEDEKTGLRYDLKKKIDDYANKKTEKDKSDKSLDGKMIKQANQKIKINPIYNEVTYNKIKLKADIDKTIKNNLQLLDDSEVEIKKTLLKEEGKENISAISSFSSSFNSIHTTASQLLSKEIKPSKSIQYLLEDAVLQEWVRKGIGHHKDKREKCAFCGSILPEDLWDKLDAHFNKESETLRTDIEALIEMIKSDNKSANNFTIINEDQLYSTFHKQFKALNKIFQKEIKNYLSNLDSIKKDVESREKDIFKAKTLSEVEDNTSAIDYAITEINKLIEKHNEKSKSLKDDQEAARKDLLLNEVCNFKNTIDYEGETKAIQELTVLVSERYKVKEDVAEKVKKLEAVISGLKTKMQDEGIGAGKVNDYLNHYFGHNGLTLVPVEDAEKPGVFFIIKRGDKEAHNLSEGECSLVAFCYFIASLEEINTKGKELIIWIDDPVSSLDYNHVFFIFSLIESVIAKPFKKEDGSNGYNYKQLFISTHNLDFLKYLKRLSRAHKKQESQYFLIDKISEKESKIRLMPDYLKNYITEFNYLFHQIFKCTQVETANEEHECFYNFGNNLRKFLEAYLFYKYPANQPIEDKLKMFFEGDQAAIDLTNRLDNELSHLEQIFDRSMRPIEIPEIPKLADYVLSKIQLKDSEQYNALLKSIGQL